MKRAVLAVVFVLLVYGVWGRPKATLKIVGELGPEMKTALAYEGIEFEERGALTVVATDRRDDLIRILASLLADQQKRLDVISNNIANSGTTKTVDGLPYRRQVVVCGPDGLIDSVMAVEEKLNWVYEPGHPDAMKEGPRAGYVAKPNVNLLREQTDFATHQKAAQALKEALAQLEPDLIVCLPSLSPKAPQPRPVDFRSLYIAASAAAPQIERTLTMEEALRKAAEELNSRFVVKQSNSVSCGQASVAMAINRISHSRLTDRDIDRLYGFQLLKALKKESLPWGYDWRDAGDVNADSRQLLTPLLKQGLPVIIALNGSFDPSGHDRGHIVVLESTEGEEVTYVDPWDGERKRSTWEALAKAPAHPDGNFIFVPFQESETLIPSGGDGML